jgi:hypothetical protein
LGSVDARIETVVAGYRIERLIGRGGMGAVYGAADDQLGRTVALRSGRRWTRRIGAGSSTET